MNPWWWLVLVWGATGVITMFTTRNAYRDHGPPFILKRTRWWRFKPRIRWILDHIIANLGTIMWF